MTTRIGFKVDADVDAALGNFEKFADAGEDAGKDAAKGVDGLASATDRARKSMDDLHAAQRRVGSYKLTAAIADMRAYEAAIKAAVAAGAGLPGWGAGGAAGPFGGGHHPGPLAGGGPNIPSGGGPAGPSPPGGGHHPGPRAGGGFGMPLTASGVLRGLGIAYTGYQVASSAFNAVRGAAVEGNDLGIHQDDLWRSMNQPMGGFSDFHKSLASAADSMKTNTAEFTQYLSEFARESIDRPAHKQTEGTKAGIGLAVGLGMDRSTGVSAIASGVHWSGGRQNVREFAGMLAFGLKQAGVVQQGGAVLSQFASWQAGTGARGGPVNNAAWWDMFTSLNKGGPAGQGVAGANLLSQADAGFRASKHNPAMAAFMSAELERRGIKKDIFGIENLLEGGIAAPVDGSGMTVGRMFMEGIGKRPFSSDDAMGAAIRDALGLETIAQGKTLRDAFGRQGMDSKKQDMLMRYLASAKPRDDAIPDIAALLSDGGAGMTEDDFRKRADEIAKRGRAPTDAQAYSDIAASAESGKLQMGWEMRDLILLKKTLDDFAWKEMLEATTGAKKGIDMLIEKIKGLGGAAEKAGDALEPKPHDGASPYPRDPRTMPDIFADPLFSHMGLDRGLLQSAAVGQMMMVSMRGGIPGQGAGGLMHASMRGSGGASWTGGKYPYQAAIEEAAAKEGIPAWQLAGVIAQESGFNPLAVGDNGSSWGMGQFNRKGAAAEYGLSKDDILGMAPEKQIGLIANFLGKKNRQAGSIEGGTRLYNGGGDPNYNANVHRRLREMGMSPDLPPASTPAQAPSATGTDVEIRLHLKDKDGNPVTTDPPKTVVRLRTQGLAPNALVA